MVRLELLSSARNAGEFGELHDELAALPDCPVGKDDEDYHRIAEITGQPTRWPADRGVL
jgi:hypothetical protein